MTRILYIFIILACLNVHGFSQIIEDHATKSIKFFPNPAINYINFEIPETAEKDLSLQIYNFIGKKVVTIPNIPVRVNLSLNDFFRGIYIFQLRNKYGKIVESGKFQVIK